MQGQSPLVENQILDDLFYTVLNHVTKPVRSFLRIQNSDAFFLFLLPLDGRYINDRQLTP